MPRRRTLKHKKSLRRKSNQRASNRRASYRRRRRNGGGWGDLPKGSFNQIAVNPGNQIHFPFSGPGKDCTGNPHSIRPGYIDSYSAKGLPGLSGGRRRKSRGGAAMPYAASSYPVTNPNEPPVSASVTPKPPHFPDTTGAGGTVAQPVVMSMPGVPPPGMAQMPKMPIADLSKAAEASNLAAPKQAGGKRRSYKRKSLKGGRYGFFPEMGPLNPVNGVGTTPAPFGRIPCEVGTYNPLNPNPNGVQTMSTAPLAPAFVTGRLSGGANGFSSANFPTVQVGQADSMRYYAPTSGYRNDFMTFRAPSPVPGLTIQTPYDARAFNQACIKTGGSRKRRSYRKGGATMPVAFDAGKFTRVTMSEIGTRKDFDGSNQGLPVKFGGKRRTRRGTKKHRKSHKKH
jgi:hypothetical protein